MSNCEALLEQAESDDNAVNQLFPIDFADPQWQATNAYSPNPDEDDRALVEFLNDLGNIRSWAFLYEPTIS